MALARIWRRHVLVRASEDGGFLYVVFQIKLAHDGYANPGNRAGAFLDATFRTIRGWVRLTCLFPKNFTGQDISRTGGF